MSSVEIMQSAPTAMIVTTFPSMIESTADTCKKPPVKAMIPRRRYITFNCSDVGDNNVVLATAASTTSGAIEGCAHICFSTDGSWFEGHLTTSDDSSYALHGHRQAGWSPQVSTNDLTNGRSKSIPIPNMNGHSDGAVSSGDDSPPIYIVAEPSAEIPNSITTTTIAANHPAQLEDSVSGFYDVTVVDHDDEQEYPFSAVRLITRSDSLWTLASPHLSFAAEKTHRGQKADMLIQKYLTPRLVGNSLKVSVGRLSMDLVASLGLAADHEGPIPRRTNSDSKLWCL